MSEISNVWSMIRKLRDNWHPWHAHKPTTPPVRDEGESAALAADGAFGPTAGASLVPWVSQAQNPLDSTPEVVLFPGTDQHAPDSQPILPVPTWTVVISDTDNDFEPIRYLLWLIGLCDTQGCWNPNIPPIRLIHTGDWLNKWNPNPHVLDSCKRLMETAPAGVEMTLLVGNHELSILRMAEMGLQTPFTQEDLAFIRAGSLTHIHEEILFLHGYPSPLLLQLLVQFQQEGTPLNDINNRLRDAFFQGEHALFREELGLELTGDVRKPKVYYTQRTSEGTTIGQNVAIQLKQLGITTVIHGHKPVAVTQSDDELERVIPGVRVINNDTGVRATGLGALLINPQGEITFINPEAMADAGGQKSYRKRLRKRLKTRDKDLQPVSRRTGRAMKSVAA
ncbi:MAG: metallophosphoesterase [Magnetococcales bacterium]|nr:metallophosphoesterase [Magnetococcales bacterium]